VDTLLVLNAGSSSLKFQLFSIDGAPTLQRIAKGQVDGVGTSPRLHAVDAGGASIVDTGYSAQDIPDLAAATRVAASWLRETFDVQLVAVGHRVVHGGPDFAAPMRVDEDLVARLERFVPLAPLHQPNNLAPIRALMELRADLPQVACFDTAFHRGHPDLADCYAIPRELHEAGVRRYGFHGLSYEFIALRLAELAPVLSAGRVIVAHLGSGASMCALRDGRSVDCTMGFTALDGLPMGTRCGQIDPGVLLYLLAQRQMSVEAVQEFLYRDCGLKGLSGISNDVRDLLASDDPRARFALDHFAYQVGRLAGSLAAVLGGLDAFVFTAGIGENAPVLRALIAERLAWLGMRLDSAANDHGEITISDPTSRVAALVIPTDEELVIARHTQRLLSGS